MARFNHIELTVPTGTLDDDGKKKIVGFYHELFGWVRGNGRVVVEEHRHCPTSRRRLLEMLAATAATSILRCSPEMPDQSLILSEAEKPLDIGEGGIPFHAGLLLDSFDEVREVHAKAKEMQKSDPEIQIMNDANMDHDGPNLGFYLRYKSPLWSDVQYIDRTRMPVVIDD